jgi:hypothetical protein
MDWKPSLCLSVNQNDQSFSQKRWRTHQKVSILMPTMVFAHQAPLGLGSGFGGNGYLRP